MVTLFGEDFTGRGLRDAKTGKYADFLESLYTSTVIEKTAVSSRSSFIYEDFEPLQCNRIVLPLSSDGETVNKLLFSTISNWNLKQIMRLGSVIHDSSDFEEHERKIDGLRFAA